MTSHRTTPSLHWTTWPHCYALTLALGVRGDSVYSSERVSAVRAQGRAVQVDSVKTRLDSAHGFST